MSKNSLESFKADLHQACGEHNVAHDPGYKKDRGGQHTTGNEVHDRLGSPGPDGYPAGNCERRQEILSMETEAQQRFYTESAGGRFGPSLDHCRQDVIDRRAERKKRGE